MKQAATRSQVDSPKTDGWVVGLVGLIVKILNAFQRERLNSDLLAKKHWKTLHMLLLDKLNVIK